MDWTKVSAELAKPLHAENVKRNPRGYNYVEGWHAIAEANRIFGFDGWTRETVEIRMVAQAERKIGKTNPRDGWGVSYTARVRINTQGVIREGVGAGHGIDVDLGLAHESAIKEAECVPITTRILTAAGFKSHFEIAVGDLVAGYDLTAGHLVWTPVHDIVTYRDAPVVRIHNHRSFDVICTPDHDWVALKNRTSSKRPFRDMNTGDAILCAAPMPGDGSLPATPEEAARVGFAICDGTFLKTTTGAFCRFAVYQSKPDTVAWCRAMYGPYSNERERPVAVGETPSGYSRAGNYPAYIWEVAAQHSQAWLAACGVREPDELPQTVARMSRSARKAMLDAMMAADGTKRGDFGKKRKPWVMDVFRILCALEGIYTGVTRIAAAGMPIVRQQSKPVVTAWNCRTEDAGRTDVWCPKTGTGTWIAQFENGVTSITGNTDAMKRALMTFGNPFGLALYDKEQTNVTDERENRATSSEAPEPTQAFLNLKQSLQKIEDITSLGTWIEHVKRDIDAGLIKPSERASLNSLLESRRAYLAQAPKSEAA